MTRKLPWATATEASTTPVKRQQATKKHKREPSASSPDDDDSSKKAIGSAQSELKFEKTPENKHGSRSPSTSPIRGPPTAAPMRPGYEADDIYIMVEDELQATAQAFTHHLHAAEYKRLKKKAREAPPRTSGMLPRLSSSAPKEVKRKFEVMALQEKQNGVLAEDREEKAKDPWLGTTLAGLMGSSSQPKRALIGSQEIQSSTRAASGFGKGESESESPNKKAKTVVLDFAVGTKPAKPERVHSEEVNLEKAPSREPNIQRNVNESTVTHDSIAPPKKPHSSTPRPTPTIETPATKPPAPKPQTAHARPRLAARLPRKKFTFDDGFDIDSITSPTPEQTCTKSTAKQKVKNEVRDESKKTKTKLHDIPTFLF